MKPQDYQLDSSLSKTTEDITLWKNENGIVKTNKDTLTAKVLFGDRLCGYVFHGKGTLLLDTIVETERGAVGRTMEKVADEPFLMLRESKIPPSQLQAIDPEDLTRHGYEDQQQFMSKAESLLNRFFEGSKHKFRRFRPLCKGEAIVFAFPNNKGRLDILTVNESSLAYTSVDRVFVKKGDVVVLTSHDKVAVSKPGRSIFLEGNCCTTMCKGEED